VTPFSYLYRFTLSIVGGVDKLYGFLSWKSNYSFICTWYYSDTIWYRDGLAVDRQGNVYISGLHSNDIQRLSPDGTFRDIVLSERDGINKPRGITLVLYITILYKK
jgi:hypothetical protein